MKAAAAGHAGRLVRRLTLIVTIVVAGAALTLALLGLFFDFRSIGKGLDTKLVTIAEVTALGVNGDQFTMFRDPSDAGRPEYEAMREHLLEVLKSQNLAYSYTVILNENKNPQLVVDGSEEAEEIGTEYDHAPELVQMYETGQPTVTPIRNEEPYGDLKTAFAPIRNSQGEIVGAVAVDLAANQIIAELLGSARYFGGMWLIVTLVGLLVGRVVARGIARRVTPLSTLAQALAGGDLTAQVSATQVGRKSDEVDDLRASLLAMQQNLMILVTELRANAGQVVSAVSGMAGAVQSLHSISREADQSMSQVAAGTGEQAANATELAGFFVQFTEGLGDFTAAAETQARLVARAAEEAAQVAEVTEQVVTAARAAAGSAGETTEAAATGTAAVSEAAGAVVQIGHAV
ncbi:MAG TPA: methyl-accepting chemotaxis protein, partial [Symbiobacteriaceae bacterium]|nr:methyl-accepting chemotaxis protein [Symbiobacteriaceae bacterium]